MASAAESLTASITRNVSPSDVPVRVTFAPEVVVANRNALLLNSSTCASLKNLAIGSVPCRISKSGPLSITFTFALPVVS